MPYELAFKTTALKEWRKLAEPIRIQFKARLAERLQQPRVPSARLSGMPDCYKIKLRSVGYRLVYQVVERRVTVVVIAVGKRDRLRVYRDAQRRRGE